MSVYPFLDQSIQYENRPSLCQEEDAVALGIYGHYVI